MDKTRLEQPAGLISVLLKADAEFGDRDDAAMDLGAYDQPEAEDALTHVALEPLIDPSLAERCAESLAEIWCRKGELNAFVIRRLTGEARLIARETIRARRPEWAGHVDSITDPPGETGGEIS